ncbi:hypothetical protein GHNINEIG_02008 [Hydrogenovibrio crunogenus]|uniref:Uncharacterized protein n=1 Tax=Hydrogenovibrio crunogenus TaxID=39765 RepID=A0A4P7P1T3_9GAMM|nr:hypothetical protein GHNINEIG_02008 [Hydrogenovibrio crunogenus]
MAGFKKASDLFFLLILRVCHESSKNHEFK